MKDLYIIKGTETCYRDEQNPHIIYMNPLLLYKRLSSLMAWPSRVGKNRCYELCAGMQFAHKIVSDATDGHNIILPSDYRMK